MPSYKYQTPRELIEANIHKNEAGCWLWKFYIRPSGYGSATWRKKTSLAHRLSYEVFVGPIPKDLELDHLCRVRHCVNPQHLEAVTREENIRRGTSPAASYFPRTACKNGHPYDADTKRRNGHRYCMQCDREKARKRYAANREEECRKERERYWKRRMDADKGAT